MAAAYLQNGGTPIWSHAWEAITVPLLRQWSIIVSAAQVLFLKDLGKSNPAAAIVNMGLTGIFVSTVLYLYLLGGGMFVIENYGRRFNKNYKEMKRPVFVNALLLFVYAISAGRHLLTLYMLKITG